MSYFLISKFDETIRHSFLGSVDFPITGQFIVDLPEGVVITTPTSYANLKVLKEAAIVALYPDLPNIEYNELDSAAKVDTAATGHRAEVGSYEWMVKKLDTSNGRITTSAVAMGGTPLQLVPFFSVYSLTYSLGEALDEQVTFTEEATTAVTVEISTDNGANWDTVLNQTSFASSTPGTNLLWRFTNASATDLYLGYYAVVWRI